MKHGIKTGLILLVLGAIIISINLFMMQNGSYLPKLLIMGTTLASLGIGFLIFKGGEPGRDVPANMKSKIHWKEAPLLSKIMWILLALGGLGGGFYWMLLLGGNL